MNQTELNADTLFAFQMALKGHKQFEWQTPDGHWNKTVNVSNSFPHRIYHDIPDGWTRHDGEDWKGDKDAKFEYIMFCDGVRMTSPEKAFWFSAENRFACSPEHRIYAYKLAAKSPAIPVIEKKVIPWEFATAPLYGKAKRKDSGELFAFECFPMEVVVAQGHRDYRSISYVLFAEKYLQLDGSVCGKEVEQ